MMVSATKSGGILCAGSIVLDTIVRAVEQLQWGTTTFVDSIGRHIGGNGANTARALGILGNRVRLTGTIGNDEAAAFALEQLAACNVDAAALTRVDQPNAATVVLVNGRGDRQFLHRLGSSMEAFSAALNFTSELTEGMQHFHLASLFVLPHLRTHAPVMLQRAREAGLSTSLDTNWDPRGEWLRVLEPCLPYVDVLFLNEDESRMITGTSDPDAASQFLHAHGAGIVVQKLSSSGCAIYTPGGHAAIRCSPFSVEAVDSTGAGDCFAAGFLSAWLRSGSLGEAGEYGNAAGALSVRAMGSVAGLLSGEDFERWMRSTSKRT